jgi:hypothetical protein
MAKRLGAFKEMLPAVSRVAVLSDPLSADQLKQVEVVNRSLGFKLHPGWCPDWCGNSGAPSGHSIT